MGVNTKMVAWLKDSLKKRNTMNVFIKKMPFFSALFIFTLTQAENKIVNKTNGTLSIGVSYSSIDPNRPPCTSQLITVEPNQEAPLLKHRRQDCEMKLLSIDATSGNLAPQRISVQITSDLTEAIITVIDNAGTLSGTITQNGATKNSSS